MESESPTLSTLSNGARNDAVKKDVYIAKITNIEDKIPHITNLANKTTLNAKIKKIKGEMLSITNLATITVLTSFEKKQTNKHNVSNLVKKLTMTQKLMKFKK